MASAKRHAAPFDDGADVTNGNDGAVSPRHRPALLVKVPSVPHHETKRSKTTVAIAGVAYCGASVTMVLVNKLALSSFGFRCPTALLWFQCLFCVVLVWLCEGLQLVHRQRLNADIIKMWLPVNVLFVLMTVRGDRFPPIAFSQQWYRTVDQLLCHQVVVCAHDDRAQKPQQPLYHPGGLCFLRPQLRTGGVGMPWVDGALCSVWCVGCAASEIIEHGTTSIMCHCNVGCMCACGY